MQYMMLVCLMNREWGMCFIESKGKASCMLATNSWLAETTDFKTTDFEFQIFCINSCNYDCLVSAECMEV